MRLTSKEYNEMIKKFPNLKPKENFIKCPNTHRAIVVEPSNLRDPEDQLWKYEVKVPESEERDLVSHVLEKHFAKKAPKTRENPFKQPPVLKFTIFGDPVGGIYIIESLRCGRKYVGSAVDLVRRKGRHFSDLKKNRHGNRFLQRIYNKYGKDNLVFFVVEFIEDHKNLISREQYYIDIINSGNAKFGFNLSPTAGNNLGIKYPKRTKSHRENLAKSMKGRKMSVETREKLSIAFSGRKMSEKSCKNLSTAHVGRKKYMDSQFGKWWAGEACEKLGNFKK